MVMTILIPLVLGIIQVGLVLHVRNTVTAAASDGARAGSTLGAGPSDATLRTRHLISDAVDARYATDVTAAVQNGAAGPTMVVRVRAQVPPLGLFGPGVPIDVTGRSIMEQP